VGDEIPRAQSRALRLREAVWRELREQGRIEPHPVFPDKEGPAARQIVDDGGVRDILALLRLNYDCAVTR
jgi:hypothetical protein